MRHTEYIPLPHKVTHGITLFYLPGWQDTKVPLEDQLRKEVGDEIDDYDIMPVPYNELPIEIMKELMGNIMEDANWHNRAGYEPDLLMDSMIKAGIQDDLIKDAFMNMMRGFEEIIN